METLLAVLAAVSMLSAAVMAAFAWKLNADWCRLVDFVTKQEKKQEKAKAKHEK